MRDLVFIAGVLCVLGGSLAAADSPPAPRQTVSLDGQWNFATDPQNVGEAQKWYAPGVNLPPMPLPGYAPAADGKIKVPGIWDAQGYGAETDKLRHNFVGKGWYKREVDPPRLPEGRRAFLRITGAHRYAKVWLDEHYLGENIGYLSAFEYDITERLAAGRKVAVTIQVDSRQRWDVDGLYGAGDLADYFEAQWGGLWGHVSIEVRPDIWLEDLFIQPQASPPACTARAVVRGRGRRATALRLEVRDLKGTPVAEQIQPLAEPLRAGAPLDVSAAIPQARPWTPDEPNLYVASLSVLDGQEVVDRVESRFGLRRIEIRGPYFHLNGKRLFLRGYGDDHIYPKEMARSADKEMYAARLRLIKSYGFNFVRHHSTIMPPEYYEACDELGMLVSAEFPIAYQSFYEKAGKAALETHKRQWDAAIRQLRNHPSIFDWCMGNEFWDGLPLAGDFAAIARGLDPTRPFVDTDGVWPAIVGRDRPTLDFYFMLFDVGKIPLDLPDKYRLDKPRKPVVSHETGNFLTFARLDQFEGFKDNVKPYWTGPGIEKMKKLGLAQEAVTWAEKSERLYLLCHKNDLEALRRNPYITGHQWWLFQDYWTTSNGIVDFLYRPKAIRPEEVRRMVSDVVLLVDGLKRTYRGKAPLQLDFVVSNYSPAELAGETIAWRVKLDGAALGSGEVKPLQVGQGEVAAVGKAELGLPEVAKPSRLTIEAELACGGTRYANDWTAWLFPTQTPPPKTAVGVFAEPGSMALVKSLGAKPIPGGESLDPKAVYVIGALDRRLVDAAEKGACLVILGGQDLAPTVASTFKTSWWKSDSPDDNNCGTVAYDHPIPRDMAGDGWCDAAWYALIQGGRKYNLEALPGRPDVIIRGIPHLHLMADLAFLWEARVGRGSVLVSGLNHAAAKGSPEGEWLLARMLDHAAGLPRPRSEIPVQFLRGKLPPPLPHVSGFRRLVEKGEEGTWHSYREDNVRAYVCRQTAVGNLVEWETSPLPAGWDRPQATFVFAGGLGWQSQPKTEGFVLMVDGRDALRFDLSPQVARWSGADGKATLQFACLRVLPEDRLGLFYATISRDLLKEGRPCRLAVRSLGAGSRRWFGLNAYTDLTNSRSGEGNPVTTALSLQRTGWNVRARRFMYPPTFSAAPAAGAKSYAVGVQAKPGDLRQEAKSDTADISLAGIWDALPAARGYTACIEALDAGGKPLARTANFDFFKVAPFAGRPGEAKGGYVESGRRCARYVIAKRLADWKTAEPGKVPLPDFPALFYSAYIRVLVTYAGLAPGSPEAQDALALARKVGLDLVKTSTPADWAYPAMPLSHRPGNYLQVSRTAMAGMAYIDLAAATGDKTFLDAAMRIADALKATQLPDGRWYFRVDPRTGKAAEDYTSDQAEAIVFLDALADQHGRIDLTATRDKAVQWMLANPVKTRHWQQQWDDVPIKAPYENLEFYDTVFFGLFLLKHATPQNGYKETAAELYRYIEDQFVLWENSYNPEFIAPSVKEQYLCYIPIDWHAAHFIRFSMAMHQATGQAVYLEKARAMADSLTAVQHPDGYYPTWMRRKGAGIDYGDIWPNCTSYTGEMLMRLGRYIEGLEKK